MPRSLSQKLQAWLTMLKPAPRGEVLPSETIKHQVLGVPLKPPFPPGHEEILFGLGCFWGAEQIFWELPGVHVTAAGYAGGKSPHPSYREVCSGRSGHAEVVLVVYDPAVVSLEKLLNSFFELHDPTQGQRQGNDIGAQYRSVIYPRSAEQEAAAQAVRQRYQEALREAGYSDITTEIASNQTFYYAEEFHQQYLAKIPNGYCGLQGTGVRLDDAPSAPKVPAQ